MILTVKVSTSRNADDVDGSEVDGKSLNEEKNDLIDQAIDEEKLDDQKKVEEF